MDASFLLLALCVALSFTTQTITGFGGVVIALTLSALFLPIPEVLPLLVPCSLLQTTAIAWRSRRSIDWRLLLRRLLPLMAVGSAVGVALLRLVGTIPAAGGPPQAAPWLGHVFGGLVVVMALRELFGAAPEPAPVEHEAAQEPPTPGARGGWTLIGGAVLAGVTHGVYASGGPLLVAVVSRLGLDKGTFRATLSALWWLLNAVLTSYYVAAGMLRVEHLPRLAALVPVLVLAFVVGDAVHDRVDERAFRRGVAAVLLVAGGALLVGR